MSRKLILTVYPIMEGYSDEEFKGHLASIKEICKGKKVGLLFVNSSIESIQKEVFKVKGFEEDTDDSEKLLDQIEDWYYPSYEEFSYWYALKDVLGLEDVGVIDFGPMLTRAGMLEVESINSKSVGSFFVKNLLHTQADFMRCFGDAETLVNEIEVNNYDVLITNFCVGSCLHEIYKRQFEVCHDCFECEFKSDEQAYALRKFYEMRLLRHLSLDSSPDMYGSWDLDIIPNGQFSVFFTSEIQPGNIAVEGIMSDRHGLSRLWGTLKRGKYLNFKTLYFLGAIEDSAQDRVTDEPINYAFDLELGKGQYWWGENTVPRTPCDFRLRRKLVFK